MVWWKQFKHLLWLIGLFALAAIAMFRVHDVLSDQPLGGAMLDGKTNIVFPSSTAIVDVTRPPYNAKGNGKTDDTDTIQRALLDVMGQHKLVYLPNGTYLVSKTIHWSKRNSKQEEARGFNFIQGQNATKTIIRLKDKTFTDPKSPQTIMWCGGFGSADWFHNYVQNVTFNVGRITQAQLGFSFIPIIRERSGMLRLFRKMAKGRSGLTWGTGI